MALILGAGDGTGPLFWTLPYSAQLIPRQIDLTIVLAGIGTSAGDDLPHFGYTVLYPLATIVKIVIAQVLLALLL